MIFTTIIPWGDTLVFFAMLRDGLRYAVLGIAFLCPHCHDLHEFPGWSEERY